MSEEALFTATPLAGACFGATVRFAGDGRPAARLVELLEAEPQALPRALDAARGLLVVHGLGALADAPELLLRLSRLFGDEVENYRETNMAPSAIHPEVPEILMVSNRAPVNRPPPDRPEPPLTPGGELPVQFPHRIGWHSDQSYRRPPPDVSLFLAVEPTPPGQGQTLYASGIAACAALPAELEASADRLQGLHAQPWTGRSEQAVRAGETPKPLAPHQRPQPQPLVRVHPVTGERALYLCERGQMDWIDGPIVGLEPGPDGEGARLVYALMSHLTRREFTYTHEWQPGDLVVYDNRTVVHCATWYDSGRYERMMWRTTVSGNPGAEYAGEAKSWVPR